MKNPLPALITSCSALTAMVSVTVLVMVLYIGWGLTVIKTTQDEQKLYAKAMVQVEQLTELSLPESQRADRMEANFDDLSRKYVEANARLVQAKMELIGLVEMLSLAGQHIQECHVLMELLEAPVPEVDGRLLEPIPEPEF